LAWYTSFLELSCKCKKSYLQNGNTDSVSLKALGGSVLCTKVCCTWKYCDTKCSTSHRKLSLGGSAAFFLCFHVQKSVFTSTDPLSLNFAWVAMGGYVRSSCPPSAREKKSCICLVKLRCKSAGGGPRKPPVECHTFYLIWKTPLAAAKKVSSQPGTPVATSTDTQALIFGVMCNAFLFFCGFCKTLGLFTMLTRELPAWGDTWGTRGVWKISSRINVHYFWAPCHCSICESAFSCTIYWTKIRLNWRTGCMRVNTHSFLLVPKTNFFAGGNNILNIL